MLLWLARLTLLAAFIAALILVRRRPDHRPFALFTAWLLATNTVRAALTDHFGLIRPPGLPPFTGPARIAFHVDEAIGLADPTAMAILAIVVFAQRRWLAWAPALAWALATAYLATHYPEIRGEPLRRVYLAAELIALALSTAAIVTWGLAQSWQSPRAVQPYRARLTLPAGPLRSPRTLPRIGGTLVVTRASPIEGGRGRHLMSAGAAGSR